VKKAIMAAATLALGLGLGVAPAQAAPLTVSWNCGSGHTAYISDTYGRLEATSTGNGTSMQVYYSGTGPSGDYMCWATASTGYYIVDTSSDPANMRVTVNKNTGAIYETTTNYDASQEWEGVLTSNGQTELENPYTGLCLAGQSSGVVNTATCLPNGANSEDWVWTQE
jgi:hypothetical protein